MSIRSKITSCGLLGLSTFLFMATSQAATIVASMPFDVVGNPNTLVQRCVNQMPAQQCSLRDAAMLSSLWAGSDTIVLSAATYVLFHGELKFKGDVTLQGAGPYSTIIMNEPSRRNRILNFASAQRVTVKNLSVTRGVLDNFEGLPGNQYEGGAGIKATTVQQLNISNVFIYDNKIVKKKGAWPVGAQPSDSCASSALYIEGGNLSLDNTAITGNDIVQDNANLPPTYDTMKICTVYAITTDGRISIQRSAIMDNENEYVTFKDQTNEIRLKAKEVYISRTLFSRNHAATYIVSSDNSSNGYLIVDRSTFEGIDDTDGLHDKINLFPWGNILYLGQNTFEEAALEISNDAVAGGNTGDLEKNLVVNNTFSLTARAGYLSNGWNKAIAVKRYVLAEPFNALRSTLLTHNTINFRAPGPLMFDTAGVFISAPAVLENNIIYAHGEPGYYKVYPCVVKKPNQFDDPLTSLGGNLIYSPDLNAMTPDTLDCAMGPSDLPPADPLLDTLKYNGGQTKTMALKPGSPALSKAPEPIGISVTIDQRDKPRPQGTGRDVGSFESDGGPLPEH